MQEELSILISKYLENGLSSEEEHRLNELLIDDAYTDAISSIMSRDFHNHTALLPEFIPVRDRNYEAIRNRLQLRSVSKVRRISRWGWAAAVVLLFAVGAAAYWASDQHTSKQNVSSVSNTDIAPGRNGAILTLADGSEISLDSVISGTVVALQGENRAKVVNGGLQYENNGGEVMYNKITTAKGRQFYLTLPDGTGVWLNSVSSIYYPTVFAGTDRRVEVTGEVYFEVTRSSKQPFFVKVRDQVEIEVLGTSFNVNAYEDETSINTMLLEGSVRVQMGARLLGGQSTKRGAEATLKPGQQAQILTAGATETSNPKMSSSFPAIKVVDNVNIDKVMAWKNGVFNFDGASLEEVMRQLKRWYDIEVVYEKEVPDIRFGGEISRGVSLSGLISGLEASEVRFRIEGRRLIVMP